MFPSGQQSQICKSVLQNRRNDLVLKNGPTFLLPNIGTTNLQLKNGRKRLKPNFYRPSERMTSRKCPTPPLFSPFRAQRQAHSAAGSHAHSKRERHHHQPPFSTGNGGSTDMDNSQNEQPEATRHSHISHKHRPSNLSSVSK